MPDGKVRHSWRRSAEFDLSRYPLHSTVDGALGGIVFASSRQRDCDQEHIDCFRNCMRRRLPSYLNHLSRGDGSKGAYCATECLKQYQDCLKVQRADALEFTGVEAAVEWLKQNRAQLLVGTIVVVAGVAFVTLSAGAGLVVLAPVVLVAA